MSELTNLLFDDLYATEVSLSRLELTEFSNHVRSHVLTIRTTQNTLRTLSSLFSSGKRVWPSACNDAIERLTSTGQDSRKFHAFIERSVHLPLAVVPLRLSLLLALKNIDAQITKMKQLLATLHDEGRTALSQPEERRHLIKSELDVLLLYTEEVLDQANHLLDRARFKERTYSIA